MDASLKLGVAARRQIVLALVAGTLAGCAAREQGPPDTLVITSRNTVELNGKPVSTEQLAEELRRIAPPQGRLRLTIHVDHAASYTTVQTVMAVAQAAGADIGLSATVQP